MNFKRKFVSVAQKVAVPVTEKTYCTFQVTKQIYSVAQKPELKTVIESVRGREVGAVIT